MRKIMAITLASCLLIGLAAQGSIVYTGFQTPVTVASGSQLYVDLGRDGNQGTVSQSAFSGADFELYAIIDKPYPEYPILDITRFGANTLSGGIQISPDYGFARPYGDSINIDQSTASGGITLYSYYNGTPSGDFTPGKTAYLGFERYVSTTERYFGWANIQYNADNSFTLFGFAYNTLSQQPILAGQGESAVPEPSSMLAGLLMLVPFGVQAVRYLRNQK
jgi:hypothetical protein